MFKSVINSRLPPSLIVNNVRTMNEHGGFVSYAHNDTPLVEDFLERMRPRTQIRNDVRIDLWWDRSLLTGVDWNDNIDDHLEVATIGLFLLSPHFLASNYITTHELPYFLARTPPKLTIPVMLQHVDLGASNLHGLGDLQIFRYRKPGTNDLRPFDKCGPTTRNDFCDQLLTEIARRLA